MTLEMHAHTKDTTSKSQIIPPRGSDTYQKYLRTTGVMITGQMNKVRLQQNFTRSTDIMVEKETSSIPELARLKKRYEE